MHEKINEGGNKDSTNVMGEKNLVEAFNKALEEHPLKTIGQDENEIKIGRDQMEHFLQPDRLGGSAYLIFKFNGDKEKEEKLSQVYHTSKSTIDGGKIYYYTYEKIIGWKKVLFYLGKDADVFEIGALNYPESHEEEVIKTICEDLKTIDNIFKMDLMDLKAIKDLFGRWRG
ncbi:MAG: hypothetical protein QW046_01645 [Candidatus Micrarchaeaceae archaeon]